MLCLNSLFEGDILTVCLLPCSAQHPKLLPNTLSGVPPPSLPQDPPFHVPHPPAGHPGSRAASPPEASGRSGLLSGGRGAYSRGVQRSRVSHNGLSGLGIFIYSSPFQGSGALRDHREKLLCLFSQASQGLERAEPKGWWEGRPRTTTHVAGDQGGLSSKSQPAWPREGTVE